ncbi:MAG TPA: haloacid dehalogenase-like hydrolase, partial [Sphingomicrobium sp.]|nr:haloacid dehalogenase-like hydrolase [Sphingomicrobium sp.]
MSDLAVYDLDRTITRRPTYTLFLIHCAVRRQQWRLVFVPVVVIAMLAYALGLFDRGRLKEICQHLLIGHKVHATELRPLAESFADATVASNIRPGARKAIERDREEGRRLVLATASYRLYADAIADRLGFDDVIATGSV